MSATKTPQVPSYTQFACVGTGFSGIGLGATLKRWYGIGDVRFFERNDKLGGTWYVNQYPGCACDVPSALYSFSFEANPDWSRVLPPQEELWQYLDKVARKYSLVEKMTFGVNVEKCEWMEQRKRWRLTVRRLADDSVFLHECQFLFSATGQLMQPRELDVPGADTFKGRLFHSSRWDKSVDVSGKRVVVFGNGCTASQIVPAIVDKTAQLTQVVRTRHWFMPPVDSANADFVKTIWRVAPWTQTLQRLLVFAGAEDALRGFYMTKSGNAYRARVQARSERYMKATAPEKYHDKIIPEFELGCKRRIFDAGYLASMHSENFTLMDEPVLGIVPEGIRTKDGVVEADVIVAANGFVTNNAVGGLEVVGRGGGTIDGHWESFGGPEAYNCTVVNGFPNFFILLGPNSLTGHTSAIIAAENSINYALRIIEPLLDGKGTVVEVKRDAEQQYVDQMEKNMQGMVWFAGCNSWYLRGSKPGKKWNASTWPYSQAYFWYRCLFPKFDHVVISVSNSLPLQSILNDMLNSEQGPRHRGRRRHTWRKVASLTFAGYILAIVFGVARNPLAKSRYWQQAVVILGVVREMVLSKLLKTA
ncbi:ATP-binding cassette [Colletotrichum sojae]|uniref:ATP-binding cassette n=1 Tax=Colletotrichum sojae TaxID=2175907 RepID=A0A8H6J668_9PEZI|nr:ATP-binding cassette [Colletotrichum sojae]